MSRLYLVRHGEAAGDELRDPGLSDQGRRQAHALVRRLEARPITEVWHGPRRRTTETAALVAAGLGVARCEPTDLLDDRTPVPSAARRGDYPAHRAAWFATVPLEERDEDGALVSRAWQELSARTKGTETLLVTHAFVAAWFVREVLDAPAAAWMRLTVANTGLTTITWDDERQARLEAFNETARLESG
jgi:broad specificity phosphatase PhoE